MSSLLLLHFLNYSFMSSTILDSRIKTYSHVSTPIFHCTQTLNCKNPWSITKVMMSAMMVLQQWRFVATLEMAHRVRCGDGELQSKQGDEVGDDIGHRVFSMTCWEQ